MFQGILIVTVRRIQCSIPVHSVIAACFSVKMRSNVRWVGFQPDKRELGKVLPYELLLDCSEVSWFAKGHSVLTTKIKNLVHDGSID